jgi:hypothetical protein
VSSADDHSSADLLAKEEALIRGHLDNVHARLYTERTHVGDLKPIGPHRWRGYIIEHDDAITHFEVTVTENGELTNWEDWR